MIKFNKKLLIAMSLAIASISLFACTNISKENQSMNTEKETVKEEVLSEENTKEQELNGELKKYTLLLDWTPNTNHSGIYAARELGYYEDAGIDLEIVQPPEDGAEVLVALGKAEFGISFQDSMMPALIGEDKLPIKAIAAILQHNTSGIISRKGEGLDRPKGMENKKYATWDLEIEKAMVKNVVEGDGGDFLKVELIPSTVTDEVSALSSKQVDAIWIYYGWSAIAAKMAGLEFDYFAFKDINPVFDYYTPVIISNENFINENKDMVQAFIDATKKGYEYCIENPVEAAKILHKEAPELSYDMVLESQKYMNTQYKADADNWGYIDADRWNSFYNWLSENGLSAEAIPENTGFTDEFISK